MLNRMTIVKNPLKESALYSCSSYRNLHAPESTGKKKSENWRARSRITGFYRQLSRVTCLRKWSQPACEKSI